MKVFRDPVYNLIYFRKREDRPILEIIDTPEFQRLRRIRQLGFSCYTYPTATHDRFSHSLGVAYVVGQLFDNLRVPDNVDLFANSAGRTVSLNKQMLKLLIQLAGLLHDIGHGPFSHAFEKVTKFDHEKMSKKIIEDRRGNIYNILQTMDIDTYINKGEIYSEGDKGLIKENFPLWITQIICDGTIRPIWIKELLSSQLDADRIDYLLRDAYMCGVSYASFDLKWLYRNIEIAKIPTRSGGSEDAFEEVLVVNSEKGLHAVESFVISRYHMYDQVYFHKTTRGLESIFRALFKRVKKLGISKKDYIFAGLYNVINVEKPEDIDVQDFIMLDDFSIYTQLHQWKDREDLDSEGILQLLCRGIIDREIYKLIKNTEIAISWNDGKAIEEYFSSLGLDFEYYILEDTFADVPYKDSFVSGKKTDRDQIMVKDKDGNCSSLSVASTLIAGLTNKKFELTRVYAHREHSEHLSKKINRKN